VPPHNHLLTVFLKMGVLGLALFLFINSYVFIYALAYLKKTKLKIINNLLIALLGAFVFWHTLALFFDVIDSPSTSIFLWIFIGSIFAAVKLDRKANVI
jgi:O-antigen ligase